MSTLLSRVIGAGVFFLFLLFSGYWLTRSGKPYPAVLFNVHKFIALGMIVFLVISVNKMHQAAAFPPLAVAGMVLTGICLAALLVTGGLMNITRPMPAAVSIAHHLLPYLAVLSTAGWMYLLARN